MNIVIKALAGPIMLLQISAFSSARGLPKEMLEMMYETRIPLVTREDVAKEINLTKSQKADIKKVVESGFDAGGRTPPSGMMGMMKGMIRDKFRGVEREALNGLTNEQQTRLEELFMQSKGALPIYEKKNRSKFKFTKDQGKQIDAIKKTFDPKREKSDFSDLEQLYRVELNEVVKIMIPSQTAIWGEMIGQKFTFDSKPTRFAKLPS